MASLNCASFQPLINQTFKLNLKRPSLELEGVDFGPAELALQLVKVEERDDEQCERFSLIFQGPADRMLPQKTYPLQHEVLGRHEIFLVPVGETVEGEGENKKTVGYKYQAVFNRLKKQG